jgi:hypothetical protein
VVSLAPNPIPETEPIVEVTSVKELDDEKRKQLRLARFKIGQTANMKTIDAQAKLEEDMKRTIERAKKFGTVVKELEVQKVQKRLERFGGPAANKQEDEAKRLERLQRFGQAPKTEDLEKRKKRLERFGQDTNIEASRELKRPKL